MAVAASYRLALNLRARLVAGGCPAANNAHAQAAGPVGVVSLRLSTGRCRVWEQDIFELRPVVFISRQVIAPSNHNDGSPPLRRRERMTPASRAYSLAVGVNHACHNLVV